MVAVADTSFPRQTTGRGQQKARGSGDGGRLMVADRCVALPEGATGSGRSPGTGVGFLGVGSCDVVTFSVCCGSVLKWEADPRGVH